MNTSKDQRSKQWLSSTGKVMQVQLLQSNLSLWEQDLSAVLCHHLVTQGAYQQNQGIQSLTISRRPYDEKS